MANPVYFTVVGDFKAFVADTIADTDANPDVVSITATVTFTPLLQNGDIILATGAEPRPTGFIASPIVGVIDSDGRLKLNSTPNGSYSYTPIRLLADTDVLELSTPLYYSVAFNNVVVNGRTSSIRSFNFQAPTTDTELNLITVGRTPGQTASGMVRLAPEAVRFDGGNLVWSYGGVDLPDPLPLSEITGPQGEAATIAVGDVTTLTHNQPATVTNSGTTGDAVLDFGIPEGEPATVAVGDVTALDAGDTPTVENAGTERNAVFDFGIPQSATISVGDVTTVAPGTPASVTDSGTVNAAVLDFEIPQGEAATIEVGTVSTGQPGDPVTVTNSGTTAEAVFDFDIPQGAAATVAVGTVTTGASGSSATVTNAGTNADAVLNFSIPRGDKGEAATIAVGTTSTLSPGASGTVTNTGSSGAAVFNFGIPQGYTGETGPTGPTGDTGPKGDAATVSVGTITTVSPTSPASVTNVGTSSAAVFNFSIPKGDTGSADQTEWASIPNKPAVVAEGATEADARASIDAEYTGNKGMANGYAGLDSAGKVPYTQLPSSIMAYQGVWDASSNTPTLANGTGDTGDVYRVTVAGPMAFNGSFGTYVGAYNNGADYSPGDTVLYDGNYYTRVGEPNPGYPPGTPYWSAALTGVISFNVGDYVIHNNSGVWEKSDSTDSVTSVAGKTGTVTLTKSDVGLSDVDNTSDAAKPISTATQTALDGKEATITAGASGQYWTGSKTWATLDKNAVGLSNVDNTTDLGKPISTATQTALDGKEGTVTGGTSAQYYRGDKAWATLDKTAVGLANVDNTADSAKPVSTATQTALDSKQSTSEKGQANGYASLNASARVPIAQLPDGLAVTSVVRTDGYLQFYSGAETVGGPVYLDADAIDGGTAATASLTTFDGGTP